MSLDDHSERLVRIEENTKALLKSMPEVTKDIGNLKIDAQLNKQWHGTAIKIIMLLMVPIIYYVFKKVVS